MNRLLTTTERNVKRKEFESAVDTSSRASMSRDYPRSKIAKAHGAMTHGIHKKQVQGRGILERTLNKAKK